MRSVWFCLPVVLALALPAPAAAATVINPHYSENSCRSCHLQLPATGSDGKTDFNFLAEEIDPTCLICHSQECCTLAKPHQSTHPSGVSEWDEKKFGAPDKLPLSNGYLTCVTCHFWRRDKNPAPKDYKLVRLVEISSHGVDWTALCGDCHKTQ